MAPALRISFFWERDDGACPPHTNSCTPNTSSGSPPSHNTNSMGSNSKTVARVFFAGGIVVMVLLISFSAWFIHRRKAKRKVFPCCCGRTVNRVPRSKPLEPNASVSSRGSALNTSSLSPSSPPPPTPPSPAAFPPGLNHDQTAALELQDSKKWQPIEEFSSFDATPDAPVKIHVLRKVDEKRDSFTSPTSSPRDKSLPP